MLSLLQCNTFSCGVVAEGHNNISVIVHALDKHAWTFTWPLVVFHFVDIVEAPDLAINILKVVEHTSAEPL